MLTRMLARHGYVHRSALRRPAVQQSAAVALQLHARELGLRLSMVQALDLAAVAAQAAFDEARARVLDNRL